MIQYQLNKEDFKAFNLYHYYHSPTTRKQYYRSWFMPIVIWLIFFVIIWYFSLTDESTPLRGLLDLSPLLVFVPLYLVYYPFAFRRRFTKIVKSMFDDGRNVIFLGDKKVSISETGIDDIGEYSSTSIKWPAIERVVLFKEYIFVYTSSTEGIIIPARAFSTDEEFNSFYNAANTYCNGN